VSYRPSHPLLTWRSDRLDAIGTVAQAHATISAVAGPGRPLEVGRPLGQAYVLRVVAEFQGFVRDLHDLAVERLVEMAKPSAEAMPLLIAACVEGRQVDRGNADLRSIRSDFRRLGIPNVGDRIGSHDHRWVLPAHPERSDRSQYHALIQIRNALAHGNQRQVASLRQQGIADTVTWSRHRLPGLGRMARALDRVVWEHLHSTFGAEPW